MKIQFFSEIQGLAEAVPIYRADKNPPQWVSKAREDYLKSDRRLTHLFKCPGIFELYSYAFVVPMWFDAIIRTEQDRFAWIGPEKLKNIRENAGELLTNHSYLTTAKHLPIRPNSIANIIKVDTPWNIIAPKGLKFLAMAYPYPDSYEFEACPGILDPSVASEVNAQLYWNVKNDEYTIKAGSPLMVLIPLTQEKIQFEVRDATDRDMLWIKKRHYLSYFKLTMDRSLVKEAYNNFFNKGKKG